MKKILWILPLLFVSHAFAQVTWYINHNGGSNLQCTGKTNAAYTGGITQQWKAQLSVGVGYQFIDNNNHLEQVTVLGTTSTHYQPTWSTTGGVTTDGTSVAQDKGIQPSNQACALNHPFWLLNSSFAWRIAANDTILFTDSPSNTVDYKMGEFNGGVGEDWGWYSGFCPAPNQGSSAGSSCQLPVFPNGVSMIGQNAGSCHDSGHTHLVTPTVLTGINNAFFIVSVAATTGVTLSCLEITQQDTCSGGGIGLGNTNGCSNGTNSTFNFVGGGGGAGILFQRNTANGPTSLTMTDVAVVGISTSGILGSKINGANSSATSTFTDVYILGNGLAGWNGDSGSCGSGGTPTGCETLGTLNLSYFIVDWNGCAAVTPYDMTKADTANAFTQCYAQNTGGYGDGFVQVAAGSMVMNVSHSFFRWNTQDGFDSLHVSDDLTTTPSIFLSDSWSEGNMGQTFKLGAGHIASAVNNTSISNCRVLVTASNFPLNPTGWASGLQNGGDVCRAQGDQWAFQIGPTTSIILQNNTTVGYGTTMYSVVCAAGDTTCVTSGNTNFSFINNISKGYPDPGNSNVLASGFYLDTISGNTTGIFANAGSVVKNNLWNTMNTGNTGCPDKQISPTPTASQCGDPLLVGESNINAINPNVTNGSSPTIGNGAFVSGYTADYNGTTVSNPPQIGAFALTGGTPTVATPTASPVAGTYGSTQTVTLSTATSGATICYTTNGTTPAATTPGTCSTGTIYTTAIGVSTTQTIKALGTLSGDTNSSVASFPYTISPTVATPTASPAAGTYTSAQTVTLSTATSGAAICYTTDGTTPTATTPGTCSHGTTYSGTIAVATSETIKAIGTLSGDVNSSVGTFAYTINIPVVVATPTASPVAGTYTSAQSVVLTSSTSGAVICYTIDGTTPTATTAGTCSHGTTYSAAIVVSTTQTVMALGTKSGDTNSSVGSFAYTINIPATVATPTASPAAGSYVGTQTVTLSTSTSGATICYTTNGTTPAATTPGTCSTGTTYSSAISVAASETVKALGTKSGDINSSVASFPYTITAPGAGTATIFGSLVIYQ